MGEIEHQTRYRVGGQTVGAGEPVFIGCMSAAYARRLRPACLCTDPPVEVYLARLSSGIVVKRMPGTGPHHAPTCPHHQSPEEAEAAAPLIGTAIQEDPDSGRTLLKLDFSLSTRPGATQPPAAGAERDEVKDRGRRLSLGDLLRYLWSEAELNHWRPEWAGRRSWGTVRHRLLAAADGKFVGGRLLPALLIVPEPFTTEKRDEIDGRHVARLRTLAESGPGGQRRLGLMLAEVKQFAPGRLGRLAVFKHLPDRPLVVDEPLMRRLLLRYEALLEQWAGDNSTHLVMLATFAVREGMLPVIRECAVALANENWTLRPRWATGPDDTSESEAAERQESQTQV